MIGLRGPICIMHHHTKFHQHRSNACGTQNGSYLPFWISFKYELFNSHWGPENNVCHHAKLHLNRSNRCCDIVIHRFFKMVSIHHLRCGVHFGMTHKDYLEVFVIVWNLIGISAVVFIIQKFEYFVCFVWKCLFMQSVGFWGIWPLKSAAISTIPPKRTSLCGNTSYNLSTVWWSIRDSNFLFFKTAAIHHLGFVGHILWSPAKGTWRSLSLCKVWLELLQYFW